MTHYSYPFPFSAIQPIHAPGAVQGFGVLIAVEEDDESGNLVVHQVSEVIEATLSAIIISLTHLSIPIPLTELI